jgi:serine/threonine protein kinase
MQRNQPLPKGFALDGYRILGTIAAGGLSIVYLACDAERTLVALKEYMPAMLSLRADARASPVVGAADAAAFHAGMRCFFEEGRALAHLRHPNVVRVLNFFRANGTAYMAMRYESGRTLQQHLKVYGAPLREEWLRALFVQLLNGLREVHAARLVHLDIKPANIWIRDDETPVLIDFGGARRALSPATAQLPPVHTPGFSSPEHHGAQPGLGPWSDIYSVGATLYSCLAGMAPPAALERAARDRLIPAARRWNDRYSPELLGAIDACLRLEPGRRPQSVLSLQKALAGAMPTPVAA